MSVLKKIVGISIALLMIVLVSAAFIPQSAAASTSEEIVHFGSSQVEAEVRRILNKPTDDIYMNELSNVTSISLTSMPDASKGIGYIDLTGLEQLPCLTSLKIKITDQCNIKNIELLRKLPTLTELSIQQLQPSYYSLRNLQLFSNLKNLKSLALTNFRGLDISALTVFDKLQRLSISYCGLKDISPIGNLGSLEELNLTGNEIDDVSPLQSLSALETLYLDGNSAVDYTSLYNNYADYANTDFILELDSSGRVVKKEKEPDNKLSFVNRDTEAMLRMLLGKLSGSLTESDLDSIISLNMGVYFSYAANDYIANYDFQDFAMLKGLRHLGIHFGKFAYYTNLDAIGKLSRLESLSLSPYSDGLEDISMFTALTSLRSFDVPFKASEGNLNALKKLTRLEKVKWPGNDLGALAAFTELKELTVTGTVNDYSVLGELPELVSINIESLAPGNLGSLKSLKGLKSLSISNLPLPDLSLLSGNTSLEKLRINYCGIKSIKPLSRLGSLKELDLCNNEITDLAPLSGLKRLEALKLSNNSISGIDSLKQLKQLRELDLGVNHIKDISALAQLNELQSLDLNNNYINSIDPLKDMRSLKELSLFRCGISDISKLARLTRLESLNLDSNSIADISVLRGMTQMKQLDVSLNRIESMDALKGMEQLERLMLCYNRITDITALYGMHRLEELDLRFNNFTDAAPLLKATRLRELYLEGNPISDYAPLQALSNATRAYIIGLTKPGYVFGDAKKTDTVAYWNGNRIPCIEIGSRYAIALKDLNFYGYDAAWVDKRDGSLPGWRVTRNSSKSIQPASVMEDSRETDIVLGKAMYAVTSGLWDNQSITFIGVNSEAYVMADQLEGYGFDVVYDNGSDTLNIHLWNE